MSQMIDVYSTYSWHDLAYRMRDDLIRSLGWQRPMNLEQSLEKTVRWYLANPILVTASRARVMKP